MKIKYKIYIYISKKNIGLRFIISNLLFDIMFCFISPDTENLCNVNLTISLITTNFRFQFRVGPA